MSRLPPTSPIARALPVLGVVALLLGALTWPLLFTYSGFATDWEHHLWLIWHQSNSIRAELFPSLFLNSDYSLLNPTFAFYGGTLYALTGALSLAVGVVQSYVLVYLLDFAAALGGWYWLGRSAGLGRWTAIVPGLIFVTSSYYIVVIYVLGDWPEFTGVSMIPLMVAAALSVLRADRLRFPPAIALAVSSIVFFGAHDITILLGLTTLAITGLAVVICVPDARRQITRRGVVRVAGVVAPAAMVSAWYLLPALAYESRTRLGHEYVHAQESIRTTTGLVSFGHLFTFSRTSAPGLPPPYDLAMALPVLAIVWVMVGIVTLPWGSHNRAWTRLLLICSAVSVLVAVVMTHVGLLLALPRQYTLIQFSYRLEIYVLMALSAAVLAGLVLAGRASRGARLWRWLAIPVCAVSLAGAVQQLTSYPYPGQDRYAVFNSYGRVETGNNEDYQDNSERVFRAAKLPTLYFPLSPNQGSSVSESTTLRAGTLVATNIAAGSYLVHVTGAKPVGIDAPNDDMVLAIGSSSGQGSTAASPAPDTITVSTGDSPPIVLGRVLSLCGLAILALELLIVPACRRLSSRLRVGRASQLDHQL
jgi:hypothetical protein